jgi:hypothetical protein
MDMDKKKQLVTYSLIIVLLIGGGIYLYQKYISNNNPSKEILKVIPRESAFVMCFTPANFLDRMRIKDLKETELGEKAGRSIKKGDSDILEDLFKDPSISGIDLFTEVFVFHSYEDEDEDEHYFCKGK